MLALTPTLLVLTSAIISSTIKIPDLNFEIQPASKDACVSIYNFPENKETCANAGNAQSKCQIWTLGFSLLAKMHVPMSAIFHE